MEKAKAASDNGGAKVEFPPNGGLPARPLVLRPVHRKPCEGGSLSEGGRPGEGGWIADLTQRREGAARPAATKEFEQEHAEKTEAEKLCQKCAILGNSTAEAQSLRIPCGLASLRLCVGFLIRIACPPEALRRRAARPDRGGPKTRILMFRFPMSAFPPSPTVRYRPSQ